MNKDLAGRRAVFNYYFSHRYQSLQIALMSLFLPTFLAFGLCNVLLLKECFLQLSSIIHCIILEVCWYGGRMEVRMNILKYFNLVCYLMGLCLGAVAFTSVTVIPPVIHSFFISLPCSVPNLF